MLRLTSIPRTNGALHDKPVSLKSLSMRFPQAVSYFLQQQVAVHVEEASHISVLKD